MAIRIEVGRRDLPVGLPTLAQVTAIRDQAQAAAATAAADAVTAAQPGIAAAAQTAADSAVTAAAARIAADRQAATNAASQAASAASTAATQAAAVATDRSRAEAATADAVAYGGNLVSSLDSSFLRDTVIATDNTTTAQPWVRTNSGLVLGFSEAQGAMTLTAAPGTAPSASTDIRHTSLTTFYQSGAMEALSVTMRVRGDHVIHSQGTFPRVRAGIAPVSDAGVVGAYVFGTLYTMTGTDADYSWTLTVPAGSKRFAMTFQFGNYIGTTAGGAEDLNTIYLKSVRVRNTRIMQVLKSTESALYVDSFAAALALGQADVARYSYVRVTGAPSNVFYRVVTGTPTYSCKSLGGSVHLIPGDVCDLRLWAGEPNGVVTYSGPAGFEDEVIALSGGTNCWPTFTAAMRWCISRNRELLVPEGNFYCLTDTNQGPYVGSGLERFRIRGMGRRISNLLFDDFFRDQPTAGNRIPMHFGDVASAEMRDLSIIGNWRGKTYDPANPAQVPTSGHMISGNTTGHWVMDNVEVEGAGSFTVSGKAGSFMATGCRVAYSAADGIDVKVSRHFQCQNSVFYRVMDDAIATHAIGGVDWEPIEQSVVVTGNVLTGTSGIWANGFSRAIISNNVGRNINGRFIGTDTGQRGSTEIIISHNICENNFHQSLVGTMGLRDISTYPADYIPHLGGTFNMFIGVSSVGVYGANTTPTVEQPFVFEADAGGIVRPHGRFDETVTVAPGQWMVSITNNIYRDSLVDGVKFSEQPDNKRGGTLWSRYGKIDPVITRYSRSDHGIYCTGLLRDVMIAGNILHGLRKPIVLGYPPGRAASYSTSVALPKSLMQNVRVIGNTLSQFLDSGVFAAGTGVVSVMDNSFDGDPLHLATNRRQDGGWNEPARDAAYPSTTIYTDAPTAVGTTTNTAMPAPTVVLSRNSFRNLYRCVGDRLTALADQSGLIFGDLVGDAAPANKGIGQIGVNPVRLGAVVTVGSNPAEPAIYGVVLAMAVRVSDTIPTSGFYFAGQVVTCTQPIVSGGVAVTGWLRRTTGSAHVLGADWSEIRSTLN